MAPAGLSLGFVGYRLKEKQWGIPLLIYRQMCIETLRSEQYFGRIFRKGISGLLGVVKRSELVQCREKRRSGRVLLESVKFMDTYR